MPKRCDEKYFYPASTIKLCAAVCALNKVAFLQGEGLDIDLNTPITIHPLFEDQKLENKDESNHRSNRITIAHEIRKMCIVSNNIAFNRLYSFVGHKSINKSMCG